MKRKKRYLDNLYTYEGRSKTYAINLTLNDYEEAFNPYDYSQFKKRDLDADFFDYICDSSREIPLRYKTKLVINLSENKVDEDKNKSLKNAIKNNLEWKSNSIKKEMKTQLKSVIFYLLFAVGFSLLAFLVGSLEAKIAALHQMLYDGLIIASWVFTWRTVETLAFSLVQSVIDNRYINRLIDSKVEFREF